MNVRVNGLLFLALCMIIAGCGSRFYPAGYYLKSDKRQQVEAAIWNSTSIVLPRARGIQITNRDLPELKSEICISNNVDSNFSGTSRAIKTSIAIVDTPPPVIEPRYPNSFRDRPAASAALLLGAFGTAALYFFGVAGTFPYSLLVLIPIALFLGGATVLLRKQNTEANESELESKTKDLKHVARSSLSWLAIILISAVLVVAAVLVLLIAIFFYRNS